MSGVALEPGAVLELLATKVERYLTSGQPEDVDAEIHASVLTSARLAAAEAGFGPAPESVTVSYERGASAYERGIYDAGIAEGRRQATEERTEEAVRIDVSLDSPAYRRQLQKMIRTGQIVLPDADHG